MLPFRFCVQLSGQKYLHFFSNLAQLLLTDERRLNGYDQKVNGQVASRLTK